MEDMFKLGPKDMKGKIWDEKGRSELVEVLVSHQQDLINAIRFTYRVRYSCRKVLHSETYGEPNGLKFDMVKFEYPSEYLTSISGQYMDGRLASIVFGTNKKTYGPFGRTGNTSNGGHADAAPSSSLVSLPVVVCSTSNPSFLSVLPVSQHVPVDHPCIGTSDSPSSSRPPPLSSIPALNSRSYDDFKYEFKPGRFGGFHGSVDDGSVYAIGVYVKPYVVYTLDDYLDDLNEDCYDDDPW